MQHGQNSPCIRCRRSILLRCDQSTVEWIASFCVPPLSLMLARIGFTAASYRFRWVRYADIVSVRHHISSFVVFTVVDAVCRGHAKQSPHATYKHVTRTFHESQTPVDSAAMREGRPTENEQTKQDETKRNKTNTSACACAKLAHAPTPSLPLHPLVRASLPRHNFSSEADETA